MGQHDVRDTVVDGLRVAWRERGRGPCVVLVAPPPLASWSFRRTMTALADRYRVLAPDPVGFGRSDKPLHGVDAPTMVGALAAWLEEVAGPCALVGVGLGATLGLAAVAPGSLRELVVADAALRPGARPARVSAQGDPEASTLARGTRATLLRLARREGVDAVAALARSRLGAAERTLLAWTAPDPPPHELRWWRARLPGAERVRLVGDGAWPEEQAAAAFARALRGFLDRRDRE